MIDDTNRHTNNTCNYTCSISNSTFKCCHIIDNSENVVEITITITEEGSEGNKKEKED